MDKDGNIHHNSQFVFIKISKPVGSMCAVFYRRSKIQLSVNEAFLSAFGAQLTLYSGFKFNN